VLTLTSHAKEVEDALLSCSLAKALMDKGVDVKPEWASNAKVLTSAVGPGAVAEFRACFGNRVGLGASHVVLEPQDEQEVLNALRPPAHRRALATVKRGGRLTVPCGPEDLSWAAVSSAPSSVCDDEDPEEQDENGHPQGGGFWESWSSIESCKARNSSCKFKITVKHTFFHAEPADTEVAPRRGRCQSWP